MSLPLLPPRIGLPLIRSNVRPEYQWWAVAVNLRDHVWAWRGRNRQIWQFSASVLDFARARAASSRLMDSLKPTGTDHAHIHRTVWASDFSVSWFRWARR